MADTLLLPRGKTLWRASVTTVWVVQAILLVTVAWLNPNQIDEDTVYYLRIAHYYASGQTHLMISAYWGPMLSWLIAPGLLLFQDPLLAARTAMAVSGMVFLSGCFFVLRAARLPPAGILVGTWITALVGVAWSVDTISPDLLMTGLLAFGTSRLLSDKWVTNDRRAISAGFVLGASYLAKAVALPVSIMIVVLLAGTKVTLSQSTLRHAIRASLLTLAGLLIVAGPWIGLLSYKYRHPMISGSAAIAHAIVGPPDLDRYHPEVRTFHQPAPGRVGAGEDLTVMPYKYWSPFESAGYAVHQLRIIYYNAATIVGHLKGFDWLGLGLVSAVFGYVFASPWRQSHREEPWRSFLIPIVCSAAIYLPVYALDRRYYLPAVPFLVSASLGFALSLSTAMSKNYRMNQAAALMLVTLSFVVGNESFFRKAFDPSASANKDYLAARVLAEKIRSTDLAGPIASVGPTHRTGLFLAYLLDVPWFGQKEEVANTDEVLSSGAALVVLPRGSTTAQQLREDPRFSSTERRLFGCDGRSPKLKFEVYAIKPQSAEDICPSSGSER